MAHSLSAKKRIRQNEKRRARNRSRRSALKNVLREANEVLLHGSGEDVVKHVRRTGQALDKAAAKGTIHRNAAARRKSRLAKRANAKLAAKPA